MTLIWQQEKIFNPNYIFKSPSRFFCLNSNITISFFKTEWSILRLLVFCTLIDILRHINQCYHGLIWKIRVSSNIFQKGHFFRKKKGTKNFTTPYTQFFSKFFHRNKALYNFWRGVASEYWMHERSRFGPGFGWWNELVSVTVDWKWYGWLGWKRQRRFFRWF